jgi:protein-S-isoprenylcysteine O-methyltransferase Ste14
MNEVGTSGKMRRKLYGMSSKRVISDKPIIDEGPMWAQATCIQCKGMPMLLRDHMAHTGAKLFRWRSFVLLAFVPAIIWAVFQGEQVEAAIGEVWGEAFEMLAVALVLLGEGLRILTVGFVPRGTSGRNTGAGQVATRLNTTGVYALVRNPLYLANCMMYLGVVLFTQSLVLAVIFVLVLLPYYERIIAAEEAFLADKFGADYRDWATVTPAFIPKLTGWQSPDMAFSWRSVVRREHASVYGAIFALIVIDLGLDWASGEGVEVALLWLLAGATVIEAVVIFLKKRTTLLNVAGR